MIRGIGYRKQRGRLIGNHKMTDASATGGYNGSGIVQGGRDEISLGGE